MSITGVKELHSGRTGSGDQTYVRTYDRVYLVTTDSILDNQPVIGAAAGLPPRWSSFPGDSQALCVDASIAPFGGEGGMAWKVTFKYSTQYSQPNPDPNPLNRAARWSCGGSKLTKPALKDNTGKPILNFAADPYDPPAEADDSVDSFRAVRNESTFPSAAKIKYKNAINSDTFQGCPPRTLKMAPITCGELQYENGYGFYPVTYEMEYRKETWDISILERGFNAVSATGKKFDIGKKTPSLLTSNLISVAVVPTDDPTKATYTAWRYYPEVAFADLGLTSP